MALVQSKIYNYAGVGNGTPLILPDKFSRFSIELTPVGGTAKIQHTIYPFKEDDDPGTVEWEDWPYGAVSAKKAARLVGSASAFRVVNVDATSSKLVVNYRNA